MGKNVIFRDFFAKMSHIFWWVMMTSSLFILKCCSASDLSIKYIHDVCTQEFSGQQRPQSRRTWKFSKNLLSFLKILLSRTSAEHVICIYSCSLWSELSIDHSYEDCYMGAWNSRASLMKFEKDEISEKLILRYFLVKNITRNNFNSFLFVIQR